MNDIMTCHNMRIIYFPYIFIWASGEKPFGESLYIWFAVRVCFASHSWFFKMDLVNCWFGWLKRIWFSVHFWFHFLLIYIFTVSLLWHMCLHSCLSRILKFKGCFEFSIYKIETLIYILQKTDFHYFQGDIF